MDVDLFKIAYGVIFLVISGFAGHFWWTYRRLIQKIETAKSIESAKEDLDNIAEKIDSVNEDLKALVEIRISTEKADCESKFILMDKELSQVKEDTRAMADSVLKAVKGLEDRLDTLMFHLMQDKSK